MKTPLFRPEQSLISYNAPRLRGKHFSAFRQTGSIDQMPDQVGHDVNPANPGMMSICQIAHDGLPGEIENDVARDTGLVDLLDVSCESLADACILGSVLLCELEVSGGLCLEDEVRP